MSMNGKEDPGRSFGHRNDQASLTLGSFPGALTGGYRGNALGKLRPPPGRLSVQIVVAVNKGSSTQSNLLNLLTRLSPPVSGEPDLKALNRSVFNVGLGLRMRFQPTQGDPLKAKG